MSRTLCLLAVVALALGACSFGDDRDERRPAPAELNTSPTSVTATTEPGIASTAGPTREATDASAPTQGRIVATEIVELAYFHIAPVDGEPAELLAQQAGFITLTRGDEDYRDALRDAGFEGPILQFLISSEINGPGPYRDARDPCDGSFDPLRNGLVIDEGQFCSEVHPNEDWFLHNGAGDRLYDIVGETGVWYHMNPASAGWREYALARIRDNVVGPSALGYDGIFLGNVELSAQRVIGQMANSDGALSEFADEDAYREAWIDYLVDISDVVRPHALLWANLVADQGRRSDWHPYLEQIDGAMLAAFATGYAGLDVTEWSDELRRTEAAIDAGKGLVLVGRGEQSDLQLQQFALGSYLLMTDGTDTYFRYVPAARNADYNTFWMYSNYDVRLGQPLGARYRSGLSWRRDFECGSVVVNASQRTAEIIESPCGWSTPVTP